MTEKPASKTSLYVASGRALGARDPDPAVRNPDFLAERLLGPEERALIPEQAAAQALDMDYAEAMKNPEATGTAMMMQIRTRFIEEKLAGTIHDGASQLVILGAGFDTRAYRLTELLKHALIFEVDHPSTQRFKMKRIRDAGIEIPANLTYVPIDFRHDDLGHALGETGYDSSRVTFFIWEGVTMYLTEDAVAETLTWIAAQATGSVLVFDFVYRSVLEFLKSANIDRLPEDVQRAVNRIRKLEVGEPWLFGIPNGEEKEFLARFGLTLVNLLPLGSEEAIKRYLTRSDGSFYVPGVPVTAIGGRANPSYCLIEARV